MGAMAVVLGVFTLGPDEMIGMSLAALRAGSLCR
jgi:hypothetical protein